MKTFHSLFVAALLLLFFSGCKKDAPYDLIIRNGILVDGSGNKAVPGDLGIRGDSIAAMGDLSGATALEELDASGLHVAPGFINMLSWANQSLLIDGRSQSDIRQGVTLEVMGEGRSMGPWTPEMKEERLAAQQDYQYEIPWNTLGEYLQHLEDKGVSANVASFVGNGTLREYVMGYEKRPPTPGELEQMKALLKTAMEEGAVGLSTSLIYVPSGHATTEEIIELAKVAASYDGMYVSHIRNEEDSLLYAVKELIDISEQAAIRSEIYHFKASGMDNWGLLDSAIALVEGARSRGLEITTDMYMYNASSTGLNVLLPAWAKDGGHAQTMEYMRDPKAKARMISETKFHVPPENILLVGFRNPDMRHLIGQTLAEVAGARDIPAAQAVAELIFEDDSRIQVVYFSMNEDNVEKKLALPYMAICSDAGSYSAEGVFLKQSTHPRAYGSFARLLAHYVRERQVISLEEAIRRLTSLPAQNLKLDRRGFLQPGYYADLVLFDPEQIQDHATFEEPHQYTTGVDHVFVNGVQVLKDGEHTGATPGRFVKGPGHKAGSGKTTLRAEGAELIKVSDGFSFTEGPAADSDGNVYFTDQPNNRIHRWDAEANTVEVFMEPAGRANGLYWDRKGRLLAAADENFQLWRIHASDSVEVLARDFGGKPFNGPNDIWVHPKGWIYFTDPYYQRPYWERSEKELEEQVYRMQSATAPVELAADEFVQPNGIIGTEDGQYLYIADIGDDKTYRYKIGPDGSLSERVLAAPMGSDGMTLDEEGNLYLTGDGVHIFSPDGSLLDHIQVPADWTANVTFGGKEHKTLFITAMDAVYSLSMKVSGMRR